MQKHVGVIIGRFQPFHEGHAHLLRTAIQECDHVIIALGSSNRHPSIKNPLTARQRRAVISKWVDRELNELELSTKTISFIDAPDNLYKEWSWKSAIVTGVRGLTTDSDKVKLYGHTKDGSSYYLREFPEWTLRQIENTGGLDATDIRRTYFQSGVVSEYKCLPSESATALRDLKKTEQFDDLMSEWKFYEQEERLFRGYPYPETLTFTCSDAVVVCQGHILMIKRKHAPGRNSWALPGGFKNRDETFEQACIRELVEETNLRVPEKVLSGSIVNSKMFDDPRRSVGIPRATMAFYIDIAPNADGTLPQARPASDAVEVKWMSFSEALTTSLFDDHIDIINWFL